MGYQTINRPTQLNASTTLTTDFRLPAEWTRQGAVMLTWPHAGTDWVSRLAEVTPVFEAIAHAVLRRQDLLVSCEDAAEAQRLQRCFDQWTESESLPGRARVLNAPADDTWARDHGPMVVLEAQSGQVPGHRRARVLDFAFNAWGGKFPWEKDNQLNARLAAHGVFGGAPLYEVDMILEGGSIETDGAGTLLTTAECLLAPTRNPGMDRAAVEGRLGELLGFDRFLWLENGYLAGDDTDSHIDTLARFCSAQCICYVRCDDPTDEHYPALSAMEAELKQFRQRDGKPYELIALPWPDAVFDEDGERLPATYANFLIINDAVLLPVYGVRQDDDAITALKQCFPTREIVAINCRPLVAQHGSLHCVTMQIPEGAWTPIGGDNSV
ncbi:agmatine deiminase family protein [Hydrocarboniclastica marina]|uniref:Agmatine deiminase family protein n=1 Tax=Hydrocarboniclastica marina TaxID=2259620 RepID=A0A4P7XJ09_9ALTE|nr:agmatine deiminase family protein [Hydrocarboniclastica marina]QCF26322.1 agmatine deiminase family protein [Hydrocarboniclastica marina]